MVDTGVLSDSTEVPDNDLQGLMGSFRQMI